MLPRFHLLTLSSLVCMSFTFLKSIRTSVQIFNLLKPFICSNSKIEGAFSTVSNIFSHKRLSMSHSTLNYNLVVYGNHSLCSKGEREEMIERALDMYLKSKRRMKINNLPGIQTSTEIDAPLPDDSSESDSDIDEIEELGLFETEFELY